MEAARRKHSAGCYDNRLNLEAEQVVGRKAVESARWGSETAALEKWWMRIEYAA